MDMDRIEITELKKKLLGDLRDFAQDIEEFIHNADLFTRARYDWLLLCLSNADALLLEDVLEDISEEVKRKDEAIEAMVGAIRNKLKVDPTFDAYLDLEEQDIYKVGLRCANHRIRMDNTLDKCYSFKSVGQNEHPNKNQK